MQFRPYSVRVAQLELDSSIPPRQNTENTINATSLLDQKLSKLDSDVKNMGRLQQRDLEAIVTLVKRMGNISSTHGLLLIKACGSLLPEMPKEGRRLLAEDVWDTLLKQNCPLDVSHYNALLRVYLDNENQLDPIEFLSMMQRNGIEPNRVIHQRLLSHYCQNGDMNGASQILEFMKLKDFPMNEFIFNDLIMGNVRANNVEDGKNIIGVMRDAKLAITSSTYTSLACGYAALGDIANVLATVQEATTQEASLLDKDILKIVYTLTVSNHSHLVEQVLPLIQCKPLYTHDCIITILELVNKGFHEVGFALLKTMPESKTADGSAPRSGMFFIRQLVKQDVDPDVTIGYCNQMKALGINVHGLVKAAEMALYFKKTDAAVSFIKEMSSQGCDIRPHYFWPILASKKENEKDVFDILTLMVDLDCPADNDTFLAHVFPYLDARDASAIINQLKAIGYEEKDFTQSLILFLIHNGDLQRSAELIEEHSVEITPLLTLSKGFIKSEDEVSTVRILQNFSDRSKSQTVANQFNCIYGEFLYHFAVSKDFNVSLLEKILLAMEEKGVKIDVSHTTLEIISRKLDEGSRAQICNLLKKLSSSDIPELGAQNQTLNRQVKASMLYNSAGKLLLHHAVQKNLEEVQKIQKELDKQNFTYYGHHYAALIDLYSYKDDLEKALYYKALLDKEHPQFSIKEHTIINLATTLVRNKKIDDAENLLSMHYTKHGSQEEPNSIFRNILQLMKSLADSEEPHRSWTFIEALRSYGYCKPERALLQPLILAYLANNQINKAVEEFLKCVEIYKCSPSTVELFAQLILQKDTANLQRVTDAAISVHGEANTLFELIMAFIDCKQLEQAKKIAETSGLRVRMERIDGICEYYIAKNKIVELELFLQVTKNIFGLNRDSMYYHLLTAYVKEKNVEGALDVWDKMQEEDLQPSDQTLHLLGTFLQEMNQPVPFTIPPAPSSVKKSRTEAVKEVLEKTKVKNSLSKNRRTELDDQYLRGLLDQDLLKDALKLSDSLFESGSNPSRDVSRYLAFKLAKAGDKVSLLHLQEKLPEFIEKRIPFKSLIAEAEINSGGADKFLTSLENEVFKYKENFPGGALLHLLSAQPESLERVKKLVDVYYQEGLSVPRNMLWIHLMKNHRFEEARKVFEETPELSSNLLFKSVIGTARKTSDVEMSQELLDQARNSTLVVVARGIIYVNHTIILLASKRTDEALETIKELQTIMNLDELNYSTRVYLMRKFQAAGVTPPFDTPQLSSDSSSSSSSDDEKKY